MTIFTATVHLKGADGKEVPRFYDLGDFQEGTAAADYAAAVSAITQVTGALNTITEGTISRVTLTSVVSEDSATPGAGDVFQNLQLSCYLDSGGEKVVQQYVPTPVIGIFQSATGKGRNLVDLTNADVIQYVQQLAQHCYVSDGEQIDTTLGNGISSGVRVVRDLKLA